MNQRRFKVDEDLPSDIASLLRDHGDERAATKSTQGRRMPRKRQKWETGDCFAIPLLDGTWSAGQVVGVEPEALNSVVCALFFARVRPDDPAATVAIQERNLLSVLFVTRDLLDRGTWQVFGRVPPLDIKKYLDVPSHRSKGFVGTKIEGSGIVRNFVNAAFGLAAWDMYLDPCYFDTLLVSPNARPTGLVTKAQ